MECSEDNFYEQHVREREPTKGGNILDLVITNELDLIGDLGVEAGLAASDHGLVRWNIYVGSERRDNTKESMDYRWGNLEGLRRELAIVDWESLLNGDIEEDWTSFRYLMRDLEKKFVPIRKSKG